MMKEKLEMNNGDSYTIVGIYLMLLHPQKWFEWLTLLCVLLTIFLSQKKEKAKWCLTKKREGEKASSRKLDEARVQRTPITHTHELKLWNSVADASWPRGLKSNPIQGSLSHSLLSLLQPYWLIGPGLNHPEPPQKGPLHMPPLPGMLSLPR